MDYFGLQTRGKKTGRRGKRKEKKMRKEKQSQGMDSMIFGMELYGTMNV